MYTAAPFALPCSNGIGFDLQYAKKIKRVSIESMVLSLFKMRMGRTVKEIFEHC
ncbi:hypothetical protein [Peribacillus simplex]|uniref:hypothetical protein n=1 Tax=Peribacillus simplex TaxID=1478 RepID=UPI000A828A9A|nr:hypothetical protein [Peribacillus simplex]